MQQKKQDATSQNDNIKFQVLYVYLITQTEELKVHSGER